MAKILSRHQNVLRELLEADRRARRRVARAREKADRMRQDAETEADSIENEARQAAAKEADRLIQEARKESEARENSQSAPAVFSLLGPTDVESLQETARANKERAVDFLVGWITAVETDA